MDKNIDLFEQGFGCQPTYKIVTPSRINIIGEHSDYFDNFVLSIAVENLHLAGFVKPREDSKIRLLSLNLAEDKVPFFEFDIKDDRYKIQWIQYIQGAIAMYAEEYKRRNLKGFDLLIDSNIPLGGGLSSSSALTMTALTTLGIANGFTDGVTDYEPQHGINMINDKNDDTNTQKLLQKFFMMGCWAEYWYGTRGGFNDHLAITCGKKNFSTLSDNRDKSFVYSPFPDSVSIIVCDTKIMHSQLHSEYDQRKKAAFSAIGKIEAHHAEVRNARDITSEMLERHKDELTEIEYRRLRHPITERERVFAFMEALKNDDFVAAGKLLNLTHASLKNDYEVTCAELDIMQEAAASIDGCFGARMVGGGFGGCVIAMVDNKNKEDFIEKIKTKYNNHAEIKAQKICCDVWEAKSGDGIKIINIES